MLAGKQDRTIEAVRSQIRAMGADVFEIGLLKSNAKDSEPAMLPRVWDPDSLLRSISWLRHENREGRNIYIRPKGEHDLSLVDDLNLQAVAAMKHSGFTPAVLVETSLGNFQAWLKTQSHSVKNWGPLRRGRLRINSAVIAEPRTGVILVGLRGLRIARRNTAML